MERGWSKIQPFDVIWTRGVRKTWRTAYGGLTEIEWKHQVYCSSANARLAV